MARDVEFNVTAADDTGSALAAAERHFKESQAKMVRDYEESQKRIAKINKDESDKRAKALDESNAKIGRGLEKVFGKSAPKLQAELGKVFASLPEMAGPAVGAVVAIAAPVIGAGLSAAVIGGAGIGGVIGGVLLAARDARVKAAGAQLKDNLLGQLTEDAAPFIGPVLQGIATIEGRFKAMNGRIASIFSGSAGFLAPLLSGALDAVDGILRGVDSLISKGKPVIDAFGKSFGILGDDIGDALSIISGDSEDSASALLVLARVIGETIKAVAWLVRGLTEVYGVISFLPSKIRDAEYALVGWDRSSEDTVDTGSILAAVQKQVGASILSAGESAGAAGQQMQTYGDRMDDAAGKGRSLYDANTRVQEAIDNVDKSIKENGTSLSALTDKGRANRDVLSALAEKLQDQYDKYVKVNGEGGKAAGIADSNRAAFVQLAGKFHISAGEANNLADQMGLLKSKKIDFYANTHDAAGRIAALQSGINGVHGKTVTIGVTIAQSQLNRVNNTLARLGGGNFAAGTSWAAVDGNSGVSRTGGPTEVTVASNVTSSLYLDGALVYRNTSQQVRARADRDAWRQRTGRR